MLFSPGVPTVTLYGERFCTRHSASHLRNAGLGELVANDLEAYLQIAGDLAKDQDRLSEMRATMRDRISKSPLMDAERCAENFSKLVRVMWSDTKASGSLRRKRKKESGSVT